MSDPPESVLPGDPPVFPQEQRIATAIRPTQSRDGAAPGTAGWLC
jgi:hypothetical protein